MHATKTTHPPAGATALLPCVDFPVWRIGWYYLPVVLLSSSIVLVISLLFNNVERQYPKFWISPSPPPAATLPGPPGPSSQREDPGNAAPSLSRRCSRDSTSSQDSTLSADEKSGTDQGLVPWIPGRVRWTMTEDKTLLQLIREGRTIDEISHEFPGRSPASVFLRSYHVPDLNEAQRGAIHVENGRL